MSARHDELWVRLRTALSTHDALPSGNATLGEIAAHATFVLRTDAVHRFVHDYYYKKQFGATDGVLSDAEADALVAQVEVIPAVPLTPPKPPAPDGKGTDVAPKPAPKPPLPLDQLDESVPFNDGADEQAKARLAAERKSKEEAERKRAEEEKRKAEQERKKRERKEQELAEAERSRRKREADAQENAKAEADAKAAARTRQEAEDAERKRQVEADKKQREEEEARQHAEKLRLEQEAAKQARAESTSVAKSEEYLRQNPADMNAHLQLADCLGKLGENQRALEVVSRAVGMDSGDPRIWNSIGVYRERLGNKEVALAAFREAVRLNPQEQLYQRNVSRLLKQLPDSAILEPPPQPPDPNPESPELQQARKNWHAFVELLGWLAFLTPLAFFIENKFALVVLLVAAGFLMERISKDRALGGCVWYLFGGLFALYCVDFAGILYIRKLDFQTWQGVLLGVLVGTILLFLNALLRLIPSYLRGRGGKFDDS